MAAALSLGRRLIVSLGNKGRELSVGCLLYTSLHLTFDDGREQEIDFEPILHGPIFGALRDPVLFNQAQLDPDFGALVWPNGADLDPMVLYDWAAYVDGIIARRQLSEPGTRSSHQTKRCV